LIIKQTLPNTYNQLLTPFQVVMVTCSSYLPLMFWIFPMVAVHYGKFDALWGVIAIVAVGAFVGFTQGVLNERFPNLFGIDWLNNVYGKIVGKSISVVYIFMYAVFIGISVRLFVFLLNDLFWPHTPPYVLDALLIVTASLGAHYGIEALARVASIINPLTTFGILTTCLTAFLQISWYGMPLKIDQVANIADSAYHLMPLFFGFNFYLMLSPYYKHTKRSVWMPLVSVAINGIVILVSFAAAAALMGWELVGRVMWSLPYMFRIVNLEGFFIEKVGVSMIIIATLYNIIFVANHLWVISVASAIVVGKSDDCYKKFLIPVTIGVGALAMTIEDSQQIVDIIDRWLTPMSWVLLLVIPTTTLALAMIRGIRGEAE
jgi:hypothetical protein